MFRSLKFILSLSVVILPSTVFAAPAASQVDFGIICSVHKEAIPIKKAMDNKVEKRIRRIPYKMDKGSSLIF